MSNSIHFPHGLGDCVYFAHALPLYVRRGYEITVCCDADKRLLFEPCGVEIIHENHDYPFVAWDESGPVGELTARNYSVCNKAASNFRLPPMPRIGSPEELWEEFISTKLDLKPYIEGAVWRDVEDFLGPLPRPIVLLHTVGNAFQDTKSLSEQLTVQLYKELLDATGATIVLLDWDNRVPRMSSYRVRHLLDDWKWIDVPTLVALIYRSDLVIGIDSGPFHLARYTDTPSIGIFPHTYHYPARVTLPRQRQLCIVPREQTIHWNVNARIGYNIVHCDGTEVTAKFVAEHAAAMLAPPRYMEPKDLASDVQMARQFVLDFARGYGNGLSANVDRHKSFDEALKLLTARFTSPVIVETGCIRAQEDWRGAGYSTYLFGAYVERMGGELSSVDISEENCAFARAATAELSRVSVHGSDSVTFLRQFAKPIDLLYLDSMDTENPLHADHALAELEAALPLLHDSSVVLIDDTVYRAGAWTGKGRKVVPVMLCSGWQIAYSSYQTLLVRNTVPSIANPGSGE